MVNQTIIQGRLTAEPELRRTQNDVAVCSFQTAWSEKYKETENRLFLNCIAWRGLAEFICRNFTKGQEVVVEGKLTTRNWQDKDGNNRSAIELVADHVHFCGPKRERTTTSNDAPSDNVNAYEDYTDMDDSDLPF